MAIAIHFWPQNFEVPLRWCTIAQQPLPFWGARHETFSATKWSSYTELCYNDLLWAQSKSGCNCWTELWMWIKIGRLAKNVVFVVLKGVNLLAYQNKHHWKWIFFSRLSSQQAQIRTLPKLVSWYCCAIIWALPRFAQGHRSQRVFLFCHVKYSVIVYGY